MSGIDISLDPFRKSVNFEFPFRPSTQYLSPNEVRDEYASFAQEEEAWFRLHPDECSLLPFPPYLAHLTTADSAYWTPSLIRRLPPSIETFRLRKAQTFDLSFFSLLKPSVTSVVIYRMSQIAESSAFFRVSAIQFDIFASFSRHHLEYLRIVQSTGSIKSRIPYDDYDGDIPLFTRLEILVLPRVTLSEDCLLALPRTLRRLDIEKIRSTGVLLHYFDEEYKARAGISSDILDQNSSANHSHQCEKNVVNFMHRLSPFLVCGNKVPTKYYNHPLFTQAIRVVDESLVNEAITVFCHIHFPGLQEFLPPIVCTSVVWVPKTTQAIYLDSSTIPITSTPALTRLSYLNINASIGDIRDYMDLPLTELDWRTNNSLRFTISTLDRLPPTLTKIFAFPNWIKFNSTDIPKSAFSWKLRSLDSENLKASSSSLPISTGAIALNSWRLVDYLHPLKRLTLPDDIGRLQLDLMHVEFCGAASFQYDINGAFLVRSFPSALQELILRGTGFQGLKWSPPVDSGSESYLASLDIDHDATYHSHRDFPSYNPFNGKLLYFRPWNFVEPSTHTTALEAFVPYSSPISLSASGKKRYNDQSTDDTDDSTTLYPASLTKVKLCFGAIAHYPLSMLPSWLTHLHLERHLIRPSLLRDMTDYLPILSTLIITNHCLLAQDLEDAKPAITPTTGPVKITIGRPTSSYVAWDGNGFLELLPRSLTRLVIDCLELPEWPEEDYAKLPIGLMYLYLHPQSKNNASTVIAWISKRFEAAAKKQ